ncbi:helix-turn-helix transcriptional regulator [Xylophilus sp.]|uniref:helix-turn-helix transcriptional regulator n=1 Tax=Xylophilus sp. TaxID=2653893 RepID=UPI0013BB4780|nr:AraC family transcriptional regulator [Xylophilus sp.]KAF1049832.1 MAG: Arabinose operon regulatory protein [Xylophilus sp.]
MAAAIRSLSSAVRTYGMSDRSDRLDFYIRDQAGRPALTLPHRHEYFQIQVNLGGDTEQHIGGAVRPFRRGMLAFILPQRLHLIPHPDDGRFVVLNFSQHFLRSDLDCDPLDLEDVSLRQVPELAPFRFQEYLDFELPDADFADAVALLDRMREANRARRLGSAEYLRGCLLQLIGLVCMRHAAALEELSQADAQKTGRRDALARVRAHVARHLTDPGLSLAGAAAAAFLSPNHLAHLLRKETGRSFTEMVLERRMALARSLLVSTRKPVADVARAAGFNDAAYFSRRFQRFFGMAPRDWRAGSGSGRGGADPRPTST